MTSSDWNDEQHWCRWRNAWTLRPGVTYLNHGSFGPSPQAVIHARERWMRELEAEPMDFFVRELGGRLAQSRQRLAQFVGAADADLLLVDNATVAMNLVATAVRLQAGDEVLTTDHDYGAVLRIWQRACDRAGAKLVIRPVPLPLEDAQQVVDAVLAGVTRRTRLLVFSHITSPTAVIFPCEALCREARRLGLTVCVDGPHAPAVVPLALDRLDCDFYAASCHKWLCGPFGSGFLYVHPRAQELVEPATLSWGRPFAGQAASWRDEFEWGGTRDPSAYLALSAAIEFLERDVGLAEFRSRTHRLAQLAFRRITDLTGLRPLVPDHPDWYGSMIALPLPDGEAEPLQADLWRRYRIEVPIVAWQGRRLVRVSCHLYNQPSDIEHLTGALAELLASPSEAR